MGSVDRSDLLVRGGTVVDGIGHPLGDADVTDAPSLSHTFGLGK
jgi:hypothetical protein